MYKKKLNKDKIKKKLSSNYEIKIQVLNNVLKYCNTFYNIATIQYILNKLYYLNTNIFFNKNNNLCILSGRQNGVYRALKISRIQLRDSKHNIYGLRKSSW
jgi:ribosomal protein S14